MWSSGEPVLLRYVNGGRVSRLHPVTLVEDSPQAVVLFLRAGTPIKVRYGADGEPISRALSYAERFAQPWHLGDGVWRDWHTLMLTPVGAGHSFWAVWDDRWELHEWYVNVQEPLRRTAFGFDTADNVLDVVIEPDLSSWGWKDEDELEEAVRVGRFTTEDAEAVREEGHRAVTTLEARTWPFDRDWSGWRPDPGWPKPELPADPAAYEVSAQDVSRAWPRTRPE